MTGPSTPPWNDLRLKSERTERLQAEMRRLGVGGLYLSDSENMRYVLNTKLPGGKLFVPAEGDPVAFVRGREAGTPDRGPRWRPRGAGRPRAV